MRLVRKFAFSLTIIPAFVATGVSLTVLLAAIVGAAHDSEPGELVYPLRAPALQLQLALTSDPVAREAIKVMLAEGSASAPVDSGGNARRSHSVPTTAPNQAPEPPESKGMSTIAGATPTPRSAPALAATPTPQPAQARETDDGHPGSGTDDLSNPGGGDSRSDSGSDDDSRLGHDDSHPGTGNVDVSSSGSAPGHSDSGGEDKPDDDDDYADDGGGDD